MWLCLDTSQPLTAQWFLLVLGQRLKVTVTRRRGTRGNSFSGLFVDSVSREEKRTAFEALDVCAMREANTLRLLELVVDEYGQDEEERGREGERVSQSSGRKRSVGYVVIPF